MTKMMAGLNDGFTDGLLSGSKEITTLFAKSLLLNCKCINKEVKCNKCKKMQYLINERK